MGWRSGEVWLDVEVNWFREPAMVPVGAVALPELPRLGPAETGLDASRRRRLRAQTERRRRLATRTVPAVALVVGSATMLPIAALRHRNAGQDVAPLLEDPPSLVFPRHIGGELGFELPKRQTRAPERTEAKAAEEHQARIEWHHATSVGLQYAGGLEDGTQLPLEGPDWVTWNPVTDSSPNLPYRLYGNDRTIRAVVSILAAYRKAHPHAPRVVIGDISFRHGGPMDDHLSHQNGLDVDVYYPRLDRQLSAPRTTSQIDLRLSQDLLDRFVAAGAKFVFVGYSTGLRGPSGVVEPYANHENHMHVRFRVPA